MIANRPNSAQLEGTPYHSSKLHPGPCSSVGMRWGTDRQTHRRARPIYISPRLRLKWNAITVHDLAIWHDLQYDSTPSCVGPGI